jgi:hypothetical protein
MMKHKLLPDSKDLGICEMHKMKLLYRMSRNEITCVSTESNVSFHITSSDYHISSQSSALSYC